MSNKQNDEIIDNLKDSGFEPCNGCGEDHEPWDCTVGFNYPQI